MATKTDDTWIEPCNGKRTKRTHRCNTCDKTYTKRQAEKLNGECKCGGRIDHRRWSY